MFDTTKQSQIGFNTVNTCIFKFYDCLYRTRMLPCFFAFAPILLHILCRLNKHEIFFSHRRGEKLFEVSLQKLQSATVGQGFALACFMAKVDIEHH